MCTYTTVLTTMSNIANPIPTPRPKSTPRNTVAKNTTIHINCTVNTPYSCIAKMTITISSPYLVLTAGSTS